MAAPSYTHDLTDWILDSDTTAWGELTNAISGGAPDEADTESALQGTNTVSQATNTTGLCSMLRVLGTPVTLSSGQVFLVWHGHGVATSLLSYASGGLRLAVSANALGDWKAWAVGGNDVPPFPYGKWVNNPIDPTITADYTNGTPPSGGTNIYGVGSMCQLSAAVAKGQPHVCDIIRYGRAEARINGGETANYATFAGYAALNDAQTARWGLIQSTTGGYLWKGLMTLGYTSAVDFRDSNATIFVQDCRKVSSTFNKIEIRQASSRVDWTGITFISLSPSTNASKGSFQVIDNADVNFDTCTFVDMNTFAFLSNSTILGTTFRRCGLITTGAGVFTNCVFDRPSGTIGVTASSPANAELITNCDFVSDGTGHGLEITGTAANMTLTNVNFSGYAVSDGSSGNEAVYVNIASGSMSLTISGGTVPSVRTAGATVTIVAGAVSATLTAIDISGTPVQSAQVLVKAANGTGPLPYQDTVTITNSGTTATVSHTGHGMISNDKVLITGASHYQNNGVFTITYISANSYSYTMATAPGSNPTGTISATFVLLSGTTNVNGEITMSKVFSADQPVSGWVRKSSGTPFYKTAPVAGTVDSSLGLQLTALMVLDE